MNANNEFNKMAKNVNQSFQSMNHPQNMPQKAQRKANTTSTVQATDNGNVNITPQPPVITNPGYLQGYLRTQIGKYMTVNFLLGTGTFVDKEGVLRDVGIDHIILEETKTGDTVVADLYSIKFVEIPPNNM